MSGTSRRLGARTSVALAAITVAILIFGVSTLRADATSQVTPPPPLPVAVVAADYASDASIEEFFPGMVAARRQSALGFERGGRIDVIGVDVGDHVQGGDVLAVLDTRAVVAQIAAADAQTAEAAAQTALTAGTEVRQAQLLERGHISQQRLDEVRTATRAARARESAAAAAADAIRVQLDLAEMTAPFDGVVTARLADEGTIAAPGQPLLELIENGSLEIRVGLPPALAASLNADRPYRFVVDGGSINARFRASTGIVDQQSRSVTVLFDIEPGTVAVGQIVRLAMATPIDADGFWVPTSALAEGRRGLWTVYVLQPDRDDYRLEGRVVETVRIEADRVFVRGAVADGELVLASGLARITPGLRVAPAVLEARAQ
ncbi:efflux RND transporter periplasmic adaptor subunit [uncultured Maricaulis sp.]|uniref:efflux RND transporter periplasmic adaptor subunit n=1 Tax=uncultured Maricaulis sp. TaxID=174710 RepID=UPI0030D7C4DF